MDGQRDKQTDNSQDGFTNLLKVSISHQVSWLMFMGIFTHFLLNALRPVKSLSEVSIYEYLVIGWVVCISLDELKQVMKHS